MESVLGVQSGLKKTKKLELYNRQGHIANSMLKALRNLKKF